MGSVYLVAEIDDIVAAILRKPQTDFGRVTLLDIVALLDAAAVAGAGSNLGDPLGEDVENHNARRAANLHDAFLAVLWVQTVLTVVDKP